MGCPNSVGLVLGLLFVVGADVGVLLANLTLVWPRFVSSLGLRLVSAQQPRTRQISPFAWVRVIVHSGRHGCPIHTRQASVWLHWGSGRCPFNSLALVRLLLSLGFVSSWLGLNRVSENAANRTKAVQIVLRSQQRRGLDLPIEVGAAETHATPCGGSIPAILKPPSCLDPHESVSLPVVS